MRRIACTLALLVSLAGCPGQPAQVPPATHDASVVEPTAAPAGYRAVAVNDGATLAGTVRYNGTSPVRTPLQVDHDRETCAAHEIFAEDVIVGQGGGLANAVVWLEGIGEGKDWPAGEVVMDQAGCVYVPHVAVVGVGRPLLFQNSDPVLHNVNTFARENPPLNVSLLPAGKGRPVRRTLKFADEVKVTCDAHRWMGAWIVVRDNPYWALAGADGAYAIAEVPEGRFRLVAWHETLGRKTQEVTLTAGATLGQDFVMEPRK